MTFAAIHTHKACDAPKLEGVGASSQMPEARGTFLVFLLSAVPHLPFSIRLHCTIGVSQQTRDFWRTLDVFFIFSCAGEHRAAQSEPSTAG